jgi:hypothetical protein
LIVINSPGAIAPNAPLALFDMVPGCGTGTPVTVTVTGTTIGVCPFAVIVIVPLYVCAAVNAEGTSATTSADCVPAAPVVPVGGVTVNQPTLTEVENATDALALDTLSVCDAGVAPPN